MDDDELIARLAGGDGGALRELFCRHAPMLATRLRAVLPAADVEDVLQETFIAAWRGARRYRPEGAVGGWLWGIAWRQAALLLRRRGPAGLSLSDTDAAEWRTSADPADAVASRLDLEEVVAALGPPGSAEREVWRLLYVEDRPVGEIADLIGVPEGTVKSRAHRTRRLLPRRTGPPSNDGRRIVTNDTSAGGSHDNATHPKYEGAPPSDVDLNRVWIEVAAEVWHRGPGWLERLAGKLLRSPGLARALLTTPSLLLPWLMASVVILGAGAAATSAAGEPLVALLAPALAAAGIAYAYGPGIDPAWELSRSMAVSDRMVLLVRALGVFALDAALGLAASAASGTAAGITFDWLVPMTAISLLALAAATLARSANVGVAAGLAAWCITVLAGKAADGQFTVVVTDQSLLPFYLVCAVVSGAVVLYATRTPKAFSLTRTPRGTS